MGKEEREGASIYRVMDFILILPRFMDDMSEDQEKGLAEFKAYIRESGITDHPQYDDYYLLRFLRARKFD